jgi:hypothetical protein
MPMVNSQNAENPVSEKHINCLPSWLLQSARFEMAILQEAPETI